MATGPGLDMWPQWGDDISVTQGGRASYALAIVRTGGFTGPICMREVLIQDPTLREGIRFDALKPADEPSLDEVRWLVVDTKLWPPGNYELRAMAYGCNEPTGPTGA